MLWFQPDSRQYQLAFSIDAREKQALFLKAST